MGVHDCPKCGQKVLCNAFIERKFHDTLFILFLLPITTKKLKIICSYCGNERKMTEKEKELYKLALKNHFDEYGQADKFLDEILSIISKNNVIENDSINDINLAKTKDEVFELFSIRQGFDKNFYDDLCDVLVAGEIESKRKNKILFR